jgi:hypothetical protein
LSWLWPNEGIYLDVDGSLINNNTLGSYNAPPGWGLGSGVTWHADIQSTVNRPGECVTLRPEAGAEALSSMGALCSPNLRFRRFQMSSVYPSSLGYKQMFITDLSNANDPKGFPFRTAQIDYMKPPVNGWTVVLPTGREFWLHANVSQRIDLTAYTLSNIEPMESKDYLSIQTRSTQVCLRGIHLNPAH